MYPSLVILLDATGEFLAHFLKRANTALVSGAACLNALPNPDFLLTEFFVKAGVGCALIFQRLFLPPQEVAVVARPACELAPVDFDNARCESLQEGPIMRDK